MARNVPAELTVPNKGECFQLRVFETCRSADENVFSSFRQRNAGQMAFSVLHTMVVVLTGHGDEAI